MLQFVICNNFCSVVTEWAYFSMMMLLLFIFTPPDFETHISEFTPEGIQKKI